MAFEDIKERLQSELKTQWEKIQDSSLFIQLKEKYENLTPPKQKMALAGVGIFLLYILLSLPLGYFSQSSDNVSEFENKRQLIRDLLKVSRDVQDVPNLPVPPAVNDLKMQIEGQLQAARLLPEQIRATEISAEQVRIIPGNLIQGMVRVALMQLNLRQIIDLGHQFQSISPSIKMTDLQMDANSRDPRYYDVTYKLAVLSVPSLEAPEEEPAPPPPTKKKGK